jgi:electron transfer flavoprotein-quinone oxidoreductase
MSEDADVDFDVIVVGAGVAGTVCAHRLARQGHEVLLIDRGAEPGSKNLSGGVFYCRVMEQEFPGFAEAAPIERRVTRNCVSFLNESSFVNVDYWDDRLAQPANAVTVLRARLDAWLAEQCEAEGVTVMPGFRVDGLLTEDGAVVGIRAGDEELRCRVVIAADGVNSFLARSLGMRAPEPHANLAVGVKSVVSLPASVIEERFHLREGEGAAYAIVGDCTQGVAGGGFLYTNEASLSLGVVLRLDDLIASGLSSSDIHDRFLAHPAVEPLVRGGELLEYGCHLTIENGPSMARGELSRPGLLLIGDAAGLTLNTGLTIRGMDLAAGSALAAATVVDKALGEDDVSAASMARYRDELGAGFVGEDLRTYGRAPAFMENPRMYRSYGPLLADVLHGMFDLDLTPRRHLLSVARGALAGSPVRLRDLVRDGVSALRAL